MSQKTKQTDDAERRRQRLLALMADPLNAPSAEEAAKMLQVSRKTIVRDLQVIRPELQLSTGLMEEYKTLLHERLPIKKRVDLYEQILHCKNPFAQLKALERIDALSGVITEEDMMKIRRAEETPQRQPMFVLPPGTEVKITMDHMPALPEVRNITPEPPQSLAE